MRCPVHDQVVTRDDTIKGFEYAKEQYVQFTNEELIALESEKSGRLEIREFVPLDSVDLLYVEKTYFIGPDKGGERAFRLLRLAMIQTTKVAVGSYFARGKEQLVVIRPYEEGLALHQMYYESEVRKYEDIPLGDELNFRPEEQALAEQLIEQLAEETFTPEKYKDEYRDRVLRAVDQKIAGQEIQAAPAPQRAQVIDLFNALKASLEQNPGAKGAALKPPRKSETPAQKPRGKTRRKAASNG